MNAFLKRLIFVISGISFANSLNNAYASDLLFSSSLVKIEPQPIYTGCYKSTMARHSTLVSENLSFPFARDPFLEGPAEPEHGRSLESRPLVQIPLKSYTPDWDLHDVRGVSEPSSLAMLGTGLLGLAVLLKRRIRREPGES